MTSLTMCLNRHPEGQLYTALFSSASDFSGNRFIQVVAKHSVLRENLPTTNAMLLKAAHFVIQAGGINVI